MFRPLLISMLLFSPVLSVATAQTTLDQLITPVPGWVKDQPETLAPSTDWDWLQLDTNEWLKGEIIALYDDELEFESDKFGIMIFGWSDVIELRSGRKYRIGLDQGETDLFSSLYDAEFGDRIIGRLYITRDKVYVSGDLGQQWTLERDEVLTITSGNPIEANLWRMTASIGITLNSGNTDSEATNIFANAKRRDANSRIILDYTGIIEETNNDETANNHRLRGFYDIFETKRFFYRPLSLEFYRDDFQNLEYRITYSPGIGFYLIDDDIVEWDFTTGPIYQESRFITVEAGENETESSAGWGLFSTAHVDITEDIEWITEYSLQTAAERTGGDTQRLLTRFLIELTSALKLDISYMLDHVQSPVADENGVTPDSTDTRLMFGLAFEY